VLEFTAQNHIVSRLE